MFEIHRTRVVATRLHGVVVERSESVSANEMAPTSNAAIVCRNRSERPASTQRAVSHLIARFNQMSDAKREWPAV